MNSFRNFANILLGAIFVTTLSLAEQKTAVGETYLQETPLRLKTVPGHADRSLADIHSVYSDSHGNLHVLTSEAHWKLDTSGMWSAMEDEPPIPQHHQALFIDDQLLLATDNGLVWWNQGKSHSAGLPGIRVNSISRAAGGQLAAATEVGAFVSNDGKVWTQLKVLDSAGRQWAVQDVRVVAYDDQDQLWIGQLAGLACQTAEGWRFYEGKDGLPYSDFTAAAADKGGKLWFGTKIGLVGFDHGRWIYRQGPQYLLGDTVLSIAVTPDATPWIATNGGLTGLKSSQMTLAEKADVYEKQIDSHIKRTPFGYTSAVILAKPGDLNSEISRTDNDNDGLWTAMYGASQCFAAAVTGSDEHKAAAKQAFEAIRFLQTVTQGGSPSPPPGYIARSILPTDGYNPNDGRREADRQMKSSRDRFWKIYEPRWPTSADGKWFWKSDTSSDELDGHYFFLPLYFDLVADNDPERERVREVVRDLTDHLLANNFQLVDVDGQPTRWAVFNPENLNQNPRWWVGRGLNSLSILAYLTVAHHVTGDSKYRDAVNLLRDKHSYEANAMVAKVQYGVGSGNQSDDEMALMNFYSLIKYALDEQLRQTMTYSMYTYWRHEQPERNPFFNFCYAVHGNGKTHQTAFAKFPLDPWDGWLEDSLQTLIDFPLDRCNWSHRNSHRLDIQFLPSSSHNEPGGEGDRKRGHLISGKVVPVENRHFQHWNTDPWRLDYGGDGRHLASGTVFLLPYWMGRFHGFISE